MTYGDGVSNGHVTDDVTWPQRSCECEAVRSAILATAWLLVYLYTLVRSKLKRAFLFFQERQLSQTDRASADAVDFRI